jgi:LysM repeat protein
MWKCSLFGTALVTAALAQPAPSSMDIANLREDVRGLSQRVSELGLKVEQLERENADLRQRQGSLNQAYATVAQVDRAIADLNRAIASGKAETIEHVNAQILKLATATNNSLDSLAKAQAARPAATPTFSENYSKEGVSYTVQKGDSLATIAKKTGAKQQDIINANKLADPSRLIPGQTLFIPGGK